MEEDSITLNHRQIIEAREQSVLKSMDTDHVIFREARTAGKAMVVMCSDGRYTADTLLYLRAMTADADLHLFAFHGGALNLASGLSLIEPGSTLKDDLLRMIMVAHNKMRYSVLINICHGPDCKALTTRGHNINEAFDHYLTVPSEVAWYVPGVRAYTLFHRNKGEKINRLYEFCGQTWQRTRQRLPVMSQV